MAKDPICIRTSSVCLLYSKPVIISCEATTRLSGWRFHAKNQEFCEGGGSRPNCKIKTALKIVFPFFLSPQLILQFNSG